MRVTVGMSRKEVLSSLPDIVLARKDMEERIVHRLGYKAQIYWDFTTHLHEGDAEPIELLVLCIRVQNIDENELFRLSDELHDYLADSPSLLVRKHVTITIKRY